VLCHRLRHDCFTWNYWISFADNPTAAMKALAQVAAEPFSVASDASEGTFHHIVDHQNGHYVLKRLIINDAERMKANQTGLYCFIVY
jgi:CPL (NUC119) domain